ncbi:MAG: hypothetical protein MHM6MM_001257 [Cercozoa sp. M6MM]
MTCAQQAIVVLDLRRLVVSAKGKTQLLPYAWTALNLLRANDATYCNAGAFQLPLLQGKVTHALLQRLHEIHTQEDTGMSFLRALQQLVRETEELKVFHEGASCLLRVQDPARGELLEPPLQPQYLRKELLSLATSDFKYDDDFKYDSSQVSLSVEQQRKARDKAASRWFGKKSRLAECSVLQDVLPSSLETSEVTAVIQRVLIDSTHASSHER